MTTWIRHSELASRFCAIDTVGDYHVMTTCSSSLSTADADLFDWSDDPPHSLRCTACEDALVRRDVAKAFDVSDVDACGGEA